ncbi:hypothetical protein LTR91_008988 [Friedmanniomyces endolithicus]|uniref:Uncharacterized protein n=1 Tax=Friedmanniomyces endolithicus TaxID=329885 RepID=A0AAN6KM50_9PEZI|nr:hypothetical protein LTR59_011755 [Friedmanniomyces endolithicus]KAK0828733.1 hypothetical protein LTR03_016486 [Friedmanniomyces endolithicus]KAK0877123.1 hypothetical protein LTR87_009049 [Friedmanniomyces endolithicus]KAK0907646.1 hypothetical protein LTR02_005359 [Friedmanniomyces endolithicus]KAK0990324.1 hypothetical protein LTR91_008988 [Friedmanniomyces endolithicus]
MAAVPLTPQQRDRLCDQIFAPVLGTLIAVSMTDNIMRTSTPYRPPRKTLHDHPERVGAGTVLQVLEHFKGQDGVAQLDKLQNSLRLSMIANLGTTCFGYVYEHFPRLNPGNQIAEVAFGLDCMSTQAAFRLAYPSTGFNIALNPQGPNWLPRMIRNAFAHANWEILPNERVRLWNWNERNQVRTFDITMSGSDLQKLVYEALLSVINNVRGQRPGLRPRAPEDERSVLSHEIIFSFIVKTLSGDALDLLLDMD